MNNIFLSPIYQTINAICYTLINNCIASDTDSIEAQTTFGNVRFLEQTKHETVFLTYTATVTVDGKSYAFGERVVIQGAILLKGLSFGY